MALHIGLLWCTSAMLRNVQHTSQMCFGLNLTPPPPFSLERCNACRVIEVTPTPTGVVRVIQFVDSFIVPRVMVNMVGLERPLEVLCSKALHNKLRDTDGDALRDAKLPDAMGNEGARCE